MIGQKEVKQGKRVRIVFAEEACHPFIFPWIKNQK